MTAACEAFGGIETLFNSRYATFGTFSPVDRVPIVQAPNAGNPRSLSPGAPLAAFAGIRAGF